MPGPVQSKLTAVDATAINSRTIFKAEDNKTSSIEDVALAEFREKKLSIAQKKSLKNWQVRLDKSKDLISLHLNKRVTLLFMQTVVCYKTNYAFTDGKTIHQGLMANAIEVDNFKQKFNAAHSATLPSLYAKKVNEPAFVYLYRSGYYDESNSTIDVIKEINEADRGIDEKFKSSKLRDNSIDLLNEISKGHITPDKAIIKFTSLLIAQIETSLKHETNPNVLDVLNIYLKEAKELYIKVQNPENIDAMLDLQMDNPLIKEVAQTLNILKNQNQLTKENVLAIIKAKIDEFPVILREKMHRKKNLIRAPNHFYDLYYYKFLSRCEGEHLPVIEQAVGDDLKSLKGRVKLFSHEKSTNSLLESNSKKIDCLAQETLALAAVIDEDDPVDLNTLKGLSAEKPIYLRPGIYQLRYRMILSDQKAQSKIKSKIENVFNKLKKESKAKNLETFYIKSFLSKQSDADGQRMLCKLLNITTNELNQKIREVKINGKIYTTLQSNSSHILKVEELLRKTIAKPTSENKKNLKDEIKQRLSVIKSTHSHKLTEPLFYKRIFDLAENHELLDFEKYLNENQDVIDKTITVASRKIAADSKIKQKKVEINEVHAVIERKISKLKQKTEEFRHQLFVELRLSHGMSQKVFKEKYKKLFPGFPMSDGTLSDIENGHREMTHQFIKQSCEIFGVNSSLFYPSHFAE